MTIRRIALVLALAACVFGSRPAAEEALPVPASPRHFAVTLQPAWALAPAEYRFTDDGAIVFQATLSSCNSGCTYTRAQLQTALNAAVAGDTLLLEQGYTYVGAFTMRRHGGTSYVTVRTGVTSTGSVLSTSLFPATDIRMTPTAATAANLAKLQSTTNNLAALTTADPSGGVGPGYWKIQWLEFLWNGGSSLGSGTILECGSDSNSTVTQNAEIPGNFIYDQNYIHGHAVKGQYRGFSNHCNNVAFKNNYVSDIKAQSEGQAIYGNSFESGHTFTNNYIEGGTEVVLYGGAGGCCRPSITVASASNASTFTLSARTNLHVGQTLTVEAATTVEETREVLSCGTAVSGALCTSNTITVTPALSVTPQVGGDVDWGLVPSDITYTKNVITRPLSHRNAILGAPQGVTATAIAAGASGCAAGTLAAGTYSYRVVARLTTAVNSTARSAASTEVSVVVPATGCVKIDWSAVTNGEVYRVYGRSAGGQNIYFQVSAPTVTVTDTGAAGTAEAVYTGSGDVWQVKNNIELKNAHNVLIEGNVIENQWCCSQSYIVTLTGANTGASNDSTRLYGVTVRNNIIRNASGVISITGRDVSTTVAPFQTSGQAGDFLVENNLAYNIGLEWATPTATIRTILLTTRNRTSAYDVTQAMAPYSVRFNHNTFMHTTGNAMLYLDLYKGAEMAADGFAWTNNIAVNLNYGLTGNNSCATSCWTTHTASDRSWQNSVVANGTCSGLPGGTAENYCPTLSALQSDFMDYTLRDFRLKSTSTYHNAASDGTDIGANVPAITAFTNIALSGDNSGGVPVLPPSITTATLGNGQVSSFYLASLAGVCPSGACTWGATGLPAGLNITAVSSTVAAIAGTPAAPGGTATVTVTLTSGQLVGTQTYLVTIADVVVPPVNPDGGLVVEAERDDRYNLDEGVHFRRCDDPATSDDAVTDPVEPVRVGDLWTKICNTPPTLFMATATGPSVTWQAMQPSGFATVTTKTTAGVVTYTAAELLGMFILRDPNGAGRSDVTPTATEILAAMPEAIVGSTFQFDIRNTADAAETITLTAGTGVTLSGTMTIAQNNTKRFRVVVTATGTPAVTVYSVGTFVH